MKKRIFVKFNYFLISGILSFTYVNGFSMVFAGSYSAPGSVSNTGGGQIGSIDSQGNVYNSAGGQTGRIDGQGNLYNSAGGKTGRIDRQGNVYNSAGGQTGRIDGQGNLYNSAGGKTGRIDGQGNVYNSAGGQIGHVPAGTVAALRHNTPDDGPGSASFERRWNADLDRDNALRRCVALYRGCHRKREKAQCDRFTASAECKSFSAQEIKDANERIFTFEDYKCSQAHDACFEGTNVHSSSCQYIAQYCQSPGTDRVLKEVRSGKNKEGHKSDEELCRHFESGPCGRPEDRNTSSCISNRQYCKDLLEKIDKKK